MNPDILACGSPERCFEQCGNRHGCNNHAYSILVFTLLHKGLVGFVFGVTMAALTSSLTSIFNSSSTIVMNDIYTKLRRGTVTNKEKMIVGRLSVVVLVIASSLWILVISELKGHGLYYQIQKVTSFLSPPIVAMFLAALFWRRASEEGAFYGFITGELIGIIRMGLEFSYSPPLCGESDVRPSLIKDFHYLYFNISLFIFTALIIGVVSLLHKPVNNKHLVRLTYQTRKDNDLPRSECEQGLPCSESGQHNQALSVAEEETNIEDQRNHEQNETTNRSGNGISLVNKFNSQDSDPLDESIRSIPGVSQPMKIYNIKSRAQETELYNDNLVAEEIISRGNNFRNIDAETGSVYPEMENHSVESSECQQRVDGDGRRGSSLSLSSVLEKVDDAPSESTSRPQPDQEQKDLDQEWAQLHACKKVARWVMGLEGEVISPETNDTERRRLERHRELSETDKTASWLCVIAAVVLFALALALHLYLAEWEWGKDDRTHPASYNGTFH